MRSGADNIQDDDDVKDAEWLEAKARTVMPTSTHLHTQKGQAQDGWAWVIKE